MKAMIEQRLRWFNRCITKGLTVGLLSLGVIMVNPQAFATAPNTSNTLKPAALYKALAKVEVTSTEFPHLKAGFVTDAAGIAHPALLSTGTQPLVWLAAKPILNIFKCAKKACANDAQGNLYERNGKQWTVYPDRLRPWTTQVHYHKALSACTKPTVTPHKGVEARCYAADKSWLYKYDISGPKPEFCNAEELRLIQSRSGKKNLLVLALPSGKIQTKIPVTPPYKPLCEYQKPAVTPKIKPSSEQ